MDEQNLEKALELVSMLISGEEVSRSHHENVALYEAYVGNAQVYDLVQKILKKFHVSLYEYKESLYLTAGEKNRVFGYTNEELKKAIGIRYNRELYLCYFIIYNMISHFYHDSSSTTFAEYLCREDVIRLVDASLQTTILKLQTMPLEEVEENSFRQLALLWEDLPIITGEDQQMRAARNSKSGYVKLVFNFLTAQKLLIESEERYYPTDRLRALIENYFEENQGRLNEIMNKKGEDEDAAY